MPTPLYLSISIVPYFFKNKDMLKAREIFYHSVYEHIHLHDIFKAKDRLKCRQFQDKFLDIEINHCHPK
jgi:hypothetical protein